ncbi:polyprenyl synthetase family protein [Saccharothrix longispora]|uniref:polyprenyl synthetase family protein n=1 Tax=Saccharothrix longispora TaxID=33920 RepID=UPI0028FD370A|nr:polyprenyl synthetase family protein [Saccharothrix longispora]MBY8851507.1 polyprenyl synthetase family protein [Saccharothrix sp. MB29]MDU0291242.1 polyprenyl synthetase family protein [Saccharothrix longispora]
MTVIDAVRSDLDSVRADVDSVIDDFLTEQARLAPDPCLPPMVEVLSGFIAGGKRLRPLFCHSGFLAAGGAPGDPALLRTAAALELFHTFALVHDDVMDRSALRRGRPTVHRLLAERFGTERFGTERFGAERSGAERSGADRGARRFGVSAAILLGDLCHSWSDELLRRAEAAAGPQPAVRELLHTMRTELIAGQYLDLVGTGRPSVDPVRAAWRVARLKTARYTVELPLRIGAALAGGDAALVRACGAYGRPVGEAFQLRDDLLGMFGDPLVTGKPALDDLRDGKPTVLMALAWQQATPGQRDVIEALHGDPELDHERAELLRDVVRSTGAVERAEQLISVRVDRALSALRTAAMDQAAKPLLAELVARATRRRR